MIFYFILFYFVSVFPITTVWYGKSRQIRRKPNSN